MFNNIDMPVELLQETSTKENSTFRICQRFSEIFIAILEKKNYIVRIVPCKICVMILPEIILKNTYLVGFEPETSEDFCVIKSSIAFNERFESILPNNNLPSNDNIPMKYLDINNKQKIIDENDQTNERKIIAANIQNDQNIKQEIIDEKSIQNNWKTDQKTINKISYEKQDFIKDMTNIQNDQNEQEINTIRKNVQNYQNIEQEITDEQNIQNNWKTDNNAEIDTVEKESENNLIQALIKQINNRFDSDVDEIKNKTPEMFKDPIMTVYKCIICLEVYVDKEFYEKHRNFPLTSEDWKNIAYDFGREYEF
ncbi:hypothetical protein G5I_02431 [Acromyrmex echinatior]|uniref:Uncharacterized protein n=1 Tax=Acromyrmex echinatior TaxID=103372 RepID=F4WAA1_ACREC|nr:hypothetical protein G5I_02431 [Acromyrmex echinatior]